MCVGFLENVFKEKTVSRNINNQSLISHASMLL